MTQKVFNVLVVIVIFAAACTARKEHHDGDTDHHVTSSDPWDEMDEFHMIMAESFHPFKDSSNLEPAKANAVAMAEAAEKWHSAPLPENADTEEIKTKLARLNLEAATFVETAKAGDDKVIGESLTKIHDLFHELQEAWYGGHEDHADDH